MAVAKIVCLHTRRYPPEIRSNPATKIGLRPSQNRGFPPNRRFLAPRSAKNQKIGPKLGVGIGAFLGPPEKVEFWGVGNRADSGPWGKWPLGPGPALGVAGN